MHIIIFLIINYIVNSYIYILLMYNILIVFKHIHNINIFIFFLLIINSEIIN